MYSEVVKKILEKAGVSEGDLIKVEFGGSVLEGWLLPRIGAGNDDNLIIKLNNGYNVGVSAEKLLKVTRLGEGGKVGIIPSIKIEKSNKPPVSLIATGGTIGTHVDYKTGGVFMCRTPEEILATVPELQDVVSIKSVSSPFTIASEDFMPWHWINLANEVAKELNSGAIGAIVTHGTDYLHYSSAALSFMLGVGKPVAFVGAQRSPDRGGFDGAMNLMCAAHYCASNYGEVALVMHGTTNDDYCLAHRGTKVRKMHSSRRDAFKSVNDEPLAKITKDGKLERINQRIAARNDSQVVADAVFEKKTYLLKSFPGAPSGLLDYVIDKGAKGIVIEGSGLGHVCTGEGGINPGFNFKEYSWIPGIKRATEAGIVVAMTTQTIFGKVNPFVYRNLRLASGAGAVYCSDLHAESAFVKLGWLLGHDYGPEKTRNLLLKDFAGEFNPRLALENGD